MEWSGCRRTKRSPNLMMAMMASVSINISDIQAIRFESKTRQSQLNSGVGWSAVLAIGSSMWSELAPSNSPNCRDHRTSVSIAPSSREDVPEPFPGSLRVLLVLVIETNQETKNEGDRGLEWAVVRQGSSGNDEQVGEETE